MLKNFSIEYLNQLKEVMDDFPHAKFLEVADLLLKTYDEEKQIFIMGNGGSAATASHFACDTNKGVCFGLEKKFKVISLNDSLPTILAYANDLSYEDIFVEQLKNFLQPGDMVVGISASGNSENVLRAVSHARKNGAGTIGLCGYDGGKLALMADVSLVARVHDMQKAEDMQMIVVHMLMQYFQKTLGIG